LIEAQVEIPRSGFLRTSADGLAAEVEADADED
jgi:hypothetical protein